MSNINLIVRAVIIKNNHILLSTPTSNNHKFTKDLYFLPGGHVKTNEPAIAALEREMLEEMNLTPESQSYLGSLECTWDNKGEIYHELNLLFLTKFKNLSLDAPPKCIESHIHFVWWPLAELKALNILPETLHTAIPAMLDESNLYLRYFSQMLNKLLPPKANLKCHLGKVLNISLAQST